MENFKEKFEAGLKNKGISARQMCLKIGITEQSYYRALRENTMTMKNYRKICDFLEIQDDTIKEYDNTKNYYSYWRKLANQLSEELNNARIKIFELEAQLGKQIADLNSQLYLYFFCKIGYSFGYSLPLMCAVVA